MALRQIDIEIFDLGGPVLRDAEFDADASGPARSGMGLRQAEGLSGQLAKGEACGAVEQDVVEGVAGTATQRAEPGVGEFPGREGVVGAAQLDVALDAEHPTSALPIVTRLSPADETRRFGRIVFYL